MTNRELIKHLLDGDLDAQVCVEQTNDSGPEPVTAAVHYPSEHRIVLEGDLFK